VARGAAPGPPQEDGAAVERLRGLIERVTFHNEDSGYSVLRLKVRGHRDLVTVVGHTPRATPGEEADCVGEWVNDARHGFQFRARELRLIPPATVEGIERYLASGMVRGIGAHFARQLVRAFGERVFEVIEREPQRLQTLRGIGPGRCRRIVDAWTEQRAVRDIMVFLHSHGVGTARAYRIYRAYGDDAVSVVRENPYQLALDIPGIGFRTADGLAQRLGIAPDSPMRVRAGVRHALQEAASEGNCGLARERLREQTATLLEVEVQAVDQAIVEEHGAERLVVEADAEGELVFLAALDYAERGIADCFARLARGTPPWRPIEPARAIPWVQQRLGIELSASQCAAVQAALAGKLTVITGGPGVGKTTVVNSILTIIGVRDVRIELCAPTGRAARRLAESTGREARTVHRLLEFDPGRGRFRHDASNPLAVDLVVLDEASMMDVVLMHDLLLALPPTAALLLVGDVDQLPSVGPGAVLADIITSGCVLTARLTEIFRQAARSRIVVNAHRINAGEMPALRTDRDADSDFYFLRARSPEEIQDRVLSLVAERIPARFGFDPLADIQVLTPMNRGSLGTRSLNVALQQRLNPGGEGVTRFGVTFSPGDKVIQMVNDYDKDVFNGDIGRVEAVDADLATLCVRFDGRAVEYAFAELDELTLAYAVSVHKSQGSEYPAVVIPFATQHYTMLERNLLYTAVTRARSLVVIVGQPRAVAMAVRRVRSRTRVTRLAQRLRERLGAVAGGADRSMAENGTDTRPG